MNTVASLLLLALSVSSATDETSIYDADFTQLQLAKERLLTEMSATLEAKSECDALLQKLIQENISPGDIKDGTHSGEWADRYLAVMAEANARINGIKEVQLQITAIISGLWGKYHRVSELCDIAFPKAKVTQLLENHALDNQRYHQAYQSLSNLSVTEFMCEDQAFYNQGIEAISDMLEQLNAPIMPFYQEQ